MLGVMQYSGLGQNVHHWKSPVSFVRNNYWTTLNTTLDLTGAVLGDIAILSVFINDSVVTTPTNWNALTVLNCTGTTYEHCFWKFLSGTDISSPASMAGEVNTAVHNMLIYRSYAPWWGTVTEKNTGSAQANPVSFTGINKGTNSKKFVFTTCETDNHTSMTVSTDTWQRRLTTFVTSTRFVGVADIDPFYFRNGGTYTFTPSGGAAASTATKRLLEIT